MGDLRNTTVDGCDEGRTASGEVATMNESVDVAADSQTPPSPVHVAPENTADKNNSPARSEVTVPSVASAPLISPIGMGHAVVKEDRNFRSHYYERVGFRGINVVDVKKTLASLMAEEPLDADKCAYFALKCPVPNAVRLQLWKTILGITAMYRNNADYVWKRRVSAYENVKRAMKVIGRVSDDLPLARNVTVVHLVFSKHQIMDLEKEIKETSIQNFMAMAETVNNICSDDIETFWIAHKMFFLINQHSDELFTELGRLCFKTVSGASDEGKLFRHMEKIGLSQDIPIHVWFRRGLAGILHESALAKIWDTLVGGSVVILAYLLAAIILCSQNSLHSCQTAKEGIRCLMSMSSDSDDMVVQKALEMWKAEGGHLMPPGFTADKKHRNLPAVASLGELQAVCSGSTSIVFGSD